MPTPECDKKSWKMYKNSVGEGEILIYGDIVDDKSFTNETSPMSFKSELDGLGEIGSLKIYINSPGGDVFAGQAIYSMIKRHKAHKTVYIDGVAASIASVIAMAGDEIVMPANSMLMIHNPWTTASGDANDFRNIADRMDKIRESIISVYEGKSALMRNEIIDLMNKETWFTALESYEYGLATKYVKESNIAASIKDNHLMLGDCEIEITDKNKGAIDKLELNDSDSDLNLWIKQLMINRRNLNDV